MDLDVSADTNEGHGGEEENEVEEENDVLEHLVTAPHLGRLSEKFKT